LPSGGWRHTNFLISLSGAIIAAIFLLRVEAKAKLPILVLSMFRIRQFSAGVTSLFIVAATLSAINFLLPFFLQNLLGYTPSQVGWIIVADSVIIMVMAPIAGALSDRLGSRLLCTDGVGVIEEPPHFLLVTVGLSDPDQGPGRDGDCGYGFELVLRVPRGPSQQVPPGWSTELLRMLARYVRTSGARIGTPWT
jgi:hypothetical protein